MPTYKNARTTQTRLFTAQDVEALGGHVLTKNGPEEFAEGDYLMKDNTGTWVLKPEDYNGHYAILGDPDGIGFHHVQVLDTVEATQQPDGSYLLADGTVVDQQEFEAYHTLVE